MMRAMPLLQDRIKRQVQGRKLGGPLFFAAAIFYLTFHALSGERGLYALFKETRHLEALQEELAKVSAERAELEHRTRLLGSGSLDRDLLDERAREVLGAAGKDEVVYFTQGK